MTWITPSPRRPSESKHDNHTTDTQCFAHDAKLRLKEARTDTAETTLPAPNVPGLGGCPTQIPTKTTVGGPDANRHPFAYDIVGNRTQLVDHNPTDAPTKNVATEYGHRPGATPTDPAAWNEGDVLFGAKRVHSHAFHGPADAIALAFLRFAGPRDREEFGIDFHFFARRHIVFGVDWETRDAIRGSLATRGRTSV
ncbi:hypothetical protein [Embleya sp. MST-111070]|uniref:hypothetical protein n=1 Tax=Embleya sp. MST-111070 TaxID=3398231 RepID=UPI003F73426E